MPRRRDVKPDELAKIVKLRESDTNWLQIERDTGVPRQIAKRAFIERELRLSREELKKAREVVAAEDLRWHRDCLIKIAESLVTILDIPSFSDVRSADNILLNLWETDILGEYDRLPYKQPTRREIRRRIRQNQRLFKSLQDHTRGKIDWKVLDNWKASWNKCKEDRDKLKEEAQKTLSNELEKNKNSIASILKGSKGKHKIEQMGDGIVCVLWQGILIGKLDELIHELHKLEYKTVETDEEKEIPKMLKDEIASTIQAVSTGKGISEIIFGKTSPMSVPIAQADRAEKVVEICTEVSDILCRGDNVKSLGSEFKIMKKAVNYLEGSLDPIILRPMILNSPKCELCPA